MTDQHELSNKTEDEVKRLLRPVLLRQKLNRFVDVLSMMGSLSVGKAWPLPEIEGKLPAGKVLVLSPHPDDDVLGCGGTIKRLCQNGSQVKTVVLTDGRLGKGTVNDDSIVGVREMEARAGASILGCSDVIFLKNVDKKLRSTRENEEAILGLLNEFNPDRIFVPSIFENHPDHIETAVILARVLRRYEGDPICYCYEVWSPLFPNTLVDITGTAEDKLRALNAHRSQVGHQNFIACVQGLNAYRAMGLGKDVSSCEAFYKCSKKEFIRMVLRAP